MSNLEKIPFKFGYKFIEEDGTNHKYSVLDWEIMQLYRKCRDNSRLKTLEEREKEASLKVKEKLDYLAKNEIYILFWEI